MEESGAKGDVLQRLAGVSFIVGAILLIVFNALYPRADGPSDTQQVLTKLANNETFSLIVFLGLAVGVWALMIGAVGVYPSISTEGATAWARLGFYGIIMGVTLQTAAYAVGLATTGAAVDWAEGGYGVTTPVYSIAAALNATSNSLFTMSIIVMWLALDFLGVGIVLSSVYPKWLGWAILILGAATVVVGFILAVTDTTQTLDLTFGVLAGLSTIWALAMGIIITRKQIQLM